MVLLPVNLLGPFEHVHEGKSKSSKYCRPEFDGLLFYDIKQKYFVSDMKYFVVMIFIFSYITYLVGNSSTCPLGNLANKLQRKRIKTSDKIKKLATYFTNWIHCYKFLKCFIIYLHKNTFDVGKIENPLTYYI